ncbi:MAG: hypothetical protein LBK62_10775 [Treponema sp.]|jgi:tetratricopeptide (TPR) repeat protein|nr:hypothetical protein [Treponema sp.]
MPRPKLNAPDSPVSRAGRFIGEKWKSLFWGNLLQVTCFSGLFLSFLIAGILVIAYSLGGRGPTAEKGAGFYRLLREYDRAAQNAEVPAAEERTRPVIETLDRELDKLEKEAGSVESWLSILKRRRQLAHLNPRYIPAYRQSTRRARQAYPYSEALAALAAAALVQDAPISPEIEAELRDCLPLFSGIRFASLRLSLHILLGDLKNPETAAGLPPPALSTVDLRGGFSASEKEALTADLAMVKLLKGDPAGAAAEIQGVLAGYAAVRNAPPSSGEFLRFAAEYFYDFGDILRSAELFSRLPGGAARQADALWLGGYADGARNIWSLLALPAADGESGPSTRSLYNLAVTAKSPEEAVVSLERLISPPGLASLDGKTPETPAAASLSRQFGLIRYSRLLDAPRAAALLEAAGGESGPAMAALLELEILRRRMELLETGRLTAETWLLLGRYPENEDLYRWGAWFFDYRRNYGETAQLLKTAGRHRFTGSWIGLHEALQSVREGNLDAAENRLGSVTGWPAAANQGLILEARRAPAKALEYYEIAARGLLENSEGPGISPPGLGDWDKTDETRRRETASRLQLRIAHCLKTLGRTGESRRVLEYALDLNPDNLNARLELSRLDVP